jgi:hypothetical protein
VNNADNAQRDDKEVRIETIPVDCKPPPAISTDGKYANTLPITTNGECRLKKGTGE